jgi:secretion/DNA translocation related TadE-like protein
MADTDREAGAGTVLGAGLAMVLLLLLAGLVLVVQAAVAASQAATAADLAALAAADAARGITAGDPCSIAGEVTARHGAALVSCRQSGGSGEIVDIATAVELPAPWGAAAGRSRAGPPP